MNPETISDTNVRQVTPLNRPILTKNLDAMVVRALNLIPTAATDSNSVLLTTVVEVGGSRTSGALLSDSNLKGLILRSVRIPKLLDF
jgi:hypothetical protein